VEIKNSDPVLDDPQAERYLNLSDGTLKQWRMRKRLVDVLPPTYRGGRVGYRLSVLENFLQSHTGINTKPPRENKTTQELPLHHKLSACPATGSSAASNKKPPV
jgi:hypothetical protein